MLSAEFRPPTSEEFSKFQKLIHEMAGIYLPPTKINLLNSRVGKRLIARQCRTFEDYFKLVNRKEESEELKIAIEKITTNETYFFREEKHFAHLQERILPRHQKQNVFRVWSAACSTGQEPYSLAMVMQSQKDLLWQILASDLNTEVLNVARQGIYSNEELKKIPEEYKLNFCGRGVGEYSGRFRVMPVLRNKIQFSAINLMNGFDSLGKFDLVVLRNVMIYFERETQKNLIEKVVRVLKPGGYLYVGHSESLHGVSERFNMLKPAIYQLK